MRVALDVSSLALDRASGLRTYTENMVGPLARLSPQELLLWHYTWRPPCRPLPLWPGTRHRRLPCPRRALEGSWRWLEFPPVEWLTGPIDVFHSLHLLVPPRRRAATVLTIHDLREYRLPHLFPHLAASRAWRARMARRAHRIIAVSEHTRRDAIELMGVDPDRVRVIPNGLDPALLVPREPRPEQGPPYVLFMSSADPRKGLDDALEAFTRADLKGYRLAITGEPPGGRWPRLPATVDRLGWVSPERLRALLAGARALLFPSHYEGFGLPIVEAFALGVPVVACRNSAIPEVAGDAAVLVPTGDRAALAGALRHVVEEPELWVERGRQRCLRFSWEQAARQVWEVYQEARDACF